MDLTDVEVRFLRALKEMIEDSPTGTATVPEVEDAIGVLHEEIAEGIDKMQQRRMIEFGGNTSLTITAYGEKMLNEIDGVAPGEEGAPGAVRVV